MNRLLAVVALVACSGRSAPPVKPEPTGDGEHGSGSAVAVVESGRTDAQCDALVAHAVSLGSAERPPDQQLSSEERTRVQAEARTTHRSRCKELSNEQYDCAVRARSLAELEACDR